MSEYEITHGDTVTIELPTENVKAAFTMTFDCGGQTVKLKVPQYQKVPIPPKTTIDPLKVFLKKN